MVPQESPRTAGANTLNNAMKDLISIDSTNRLLLAPAWLPVVAFMTSIALATEVAKIGRPVLSRTGRQTKANPET